ncbi:hypothetical protein BKI52_37850 [marine bacterium AO1-C]|nr:hypothetical protein BKI52_37850 [marine bacterium AO1-C]
MYKWLLLFLFTPLCFLCYGQQSTTAVDVDSLEESLGKSIDDPTRIALLNQLSEAYINSRYQKAILYNQQAIKHATSTSNQKGLAKAFAIRGTLLKLQRKPLEAISAYKKADSLYTRLVDMPNKVDCYVMLANVFIEYQDTTQTLKYLEEGLIISSGNKYTAGVIAAATHLGTIYASQKNSKQFEKMLQDATKAANQLKSSKSKELGVIYAHFGYLYLQQKQYNKASELLLQALQNSQKAKDQPTTIRGLHYLGLVYKATQKDNKASDYFNQSIKMAVDNDTKFLLSENYLCLARLLTKAGASTEAINQGLSFAEKAYEITSDYTNPALGRDAVKILLNIYDQKNEQAKVGEYRRVYQTLTDTLQNRTIQKRLALQAFQLKTQQQTQIERINDKHLQKIDAANNQKQWLVLALFLIGGGLTIVLIRLYLRNNKRTKAYAQSTQDTMQTLEQKNKQIDELNESIANQSQELQNNQKQIQQKDKTIAESEQQTALHKQYIHDSKVFTGEIQKVMLPDTERRRKVLPDHFILYQPKDILSGDFYWVKKVKPYVVMVTADCSGQGVPSAVVGMLAISFLNNIVQNDMKLDAGSILDKLREKVQQTIKKDDSENEEQKGRIEMALAMLNTKTMELQYAGAYNALHLIRPTRSLENFQFTANIRSMQQGDHTLLEIKADKQPVGHFIKEKPFTTQHLTLQRDDKLYMFTNGYVDQPNYKNRLFNKSQLKTLLLEIHNKPMVEQEEILAKTFADWKGDRPQIDDILLMGVHIDQEWFQMYMNDRTAFF